MVFFELVLAHLLGDFVFQSNDLILKKYKSWRGSFEHVCILAAFTALFLFPYWNHQETWMITGIILAVHFIQDLLKVEYDVHLNKIRKSTMPFFLDQILHLSLLAYLSPFFSTLEPFELPDWIAKIYFSKYLIIYFIGLVLFSYTYDITLYQFLQKKSKKLLKYKPDFHRMGQRLLLYSIATVLLMMLTYGFM